MAMVLLFYGMPNPVLAEAIQNPFQLTGIDIEKGTKEFTMSLEVKEEMQLSAFDLVVEYDNTVLEVVDKANGGYSFTNEFESYYKNEEEGRNGFLSCNDKDKQKLIFAGAMTLTKPVTEVSGFAGTIAQVSFRVKEEAQKDSTLLNLRVENVAEEIDNKIEPIAIVNPNISYRLVLKDSSWIAGDVNQDQRVDLLDVQLALRAALRIITLDAQQIEIADFNLNAQVDLSDARLILKKTMNIVD